MVALNYSDVRTPRTFPDQTQRYRTKPPAYVSYVLGSKLGVDEAVRVSLCAETDVFCYSGAPPQGSACWLGCHSTWRAASDPCRHVFDWVFTLSVGAPSSSELTRIRSSPSTRARLAASSFFQDAGDDTTLYETFLRGSYRERNCTQSFGYKNADDWELRRK